MKRNARFLFVYDLNDIWCRRFVQSMARPFLGLDISTANPKLSTLLFKINKFDLAHFFLPAEHPLIRKTRKTKVVRTLLGPPKKPANYKKIFLGDTAVVFSEYEKRQIQQFVPDARVEVIPPCLDLPDVNHLQPSSHVRERYEVGDRLMVVALSDISNQQHFDAFIYIVREYSRAGGFRFVIPQYKRDHNTIKWRAHLQEQIRKEKLEGTILLDGEVDLDSLLDSTDITVYLRKDRDASFDLPIRVLESTSLGKPVLCFNIPPLNEILGEVQAQWVCMNTEDIVRESKDIKKEAASLEQIATELARYGKRRFATETIASKYREIYARLLS